LPPRRPELRGGHLPEIQTHYLFAEAEAAGSDR
jgi:hypothetical protein